MRIFRFVPILLVVLLLIPNSTAYKVEPTWNIPIYNQGDYAQFKLYGDKNQSNISLNINYYYDPDPLDLDDNTSLSATKWFSGISLNESGIGYFEVKLIKEHGFEEIGFYNLSFIFGADVINKSGNQTYTAPRFYQVIEIRYNPMYIIEENRKNNMDMKNSQNDFMDWGKDILTKAIFFLLMVAFVLGAIVFKFWWDLYKDKSITMTVWGGVLKAFRFISKEPLGDQSESMTSKNQKEKWRRVRRSAKNAIIKIDVKVRDFDRRVGIFGLRKQKYMADIAFADKLTGTDDPHRDFDPVVPSLNPTPTPNPTTKSKKVKKGR